jgi:tetratricopeptide (TPR) repeat protein
MIVTFYSFKGGVGRSMALANVAEILADWGYRVIICDWDLEAPGLERYMTSLEYYLASGTNDEERKKAYEQSQREAVEYQSRPGLMDLLVEYKKTMTRPPLEVRQRVRQEAGGAGDYFEKSFEKVGGLYLRRPSTYAFPVSTHRPRPGSLRLLTAGGRKDYASYAEVVRSFSWEEFYGEWAGDSYIEFFRGDLVREADVVLVDSRTGVTEHGGVATHHLPDMVVIVSAANQMNIEGTQWMAAKLSDPELRESRGGRNLHVLPLPSRIEQTAEKTDLVTFQAEFLRDFGRYAPLHDGADAKEFYLAVEIPYIPFYSFKERIVAREEDEKRAANLYKSYKAVARHIVNQGVAAGLLEAKAKRAQPLGGAHTTPERAVKVPHAPVLLSYSDSAREAAEVLAEGLRAANVVVVVTPASRPAAAGDAGQGSPQAEAVQPAGHIFLAGREGFGPRLGAELCDAFRQCALRPNDFRLLTLLAHGTSPKVLPPYAAGLKPFELPESFDESSTSLFLRLVAELSSAVVPAQENALPYLGFEHFDEGQARFFFGRDAEVAELVGMLGETPRGHFRWLHIEGPNGSGKTSLARAGLVPAIRRGLVQGAPAEWKVAHLTLAKDLTECLTKALHDPSLGETPSELQARLAGGRGLGEVIRGLTPPGHAFLLVVDNLEILFDGEVKPEEAESFLGQLRSAAGEPGLPFYLVTTLHGDYAGRLGQFVPPGAAQHYRLGRMDEAALTQAVNGPAKLGGLVLEEGLLERIVSEVSELEEPLALFGPLVRGLWEKRTGNLLTHGAYQKLGGVRGLLLQQADALANDLAPPQVERMRRVAVELALSGSAAAGLMRPGSGFSITYEEALAAAGGDQEARSLLDRLLAPPRLLVLDDGRVSLLHESLAREWGRLRDWVAGSSLLFERREAIAARALAADDSFRRAAASWENGGRGDGRLLLSGRALSEAKSILRSKPDGLSDAEREFIRLSSSRVQRRRLMVAGAVLAGALALGFLYYARRTVNIQTAGSAFETGMAKLRENRAEALKEFNTAVELDPTSHDAYYQRGRILAEEGRLDLAAADFEKATSLKPDFADAYRDYALTLERANNYEAAIKPWNEYVRLTNSAEAYLRRGSANAELGRRGEALRDFDEAIKLDANLAEAYNARANVYRDAKNLNLSLADYSRAVELKGDYAEAYNNRGYAYAGAQPPHYEDAVDDYSRAIELKPDYAEAYFNRGAAYLRLDKYEPALGDFNRAIALDPRAARAFSGRCEVNLKFKKDLDAAEADCKKAIEINPSLPEAFVSLGQVYAAKDAAATAARQGPNVPAQEDYNARAVESYSKALELDPELTEVYLYRGEAYKKRERAKAVADLLKFLSLTGDAELETRARRSLKELAYQTPASKTTVSLYTPPEDNEFLIDAIRDDLTRLGYTVTVIPTADVPHEESDVRYFQPEDEQRAREVEKVIVDAIGRQGYSFTFPSVNGLLRYGRTRRVAFGTVEVRLPAVSSAR